MSRQATPSEHKGKIYTVCLWVDAVLKDTVTTRSFREARYTWRRFVRMSVGAEGWAAELKINGEHVPYYQAEKLMRGRSDVS